MGDTADQTGLPPDGHVHTEWSWDTVVGSMEDSCACAVALGLLSIAFTEHADLTPWTMPTDIVPSLPEHFRVRLRSDGVLQPLDMDVAGYLVCLQRCRERFPALRLLSGVELGEPHWRPDRAKELLRAGSFQRVLGAVHALPADDGFVEVSMASRHWPAERVVREYLSGVLRTPRWRPAGRRSASARRTRSPGCRAVSAMSLRWPSPAGSAQAARHTTCGRGATHHEGDGPRPWRGAWRGVSPGSRSIHASSADRRCTPLGRRASTRTVGPRRRRMKGIST